MKYLLVVIAILATQLLSCGATRPGMPERVGGLLGAKVIDGPCLETDVILVFFKDASAQQPGAVVPIGRGCRCAYTINGVEYFPSQTFPQEMCEEYRLKKLKEKEEETNEQSRSSAPAEPESHGL